MYKEVYSLADSTGGIDEHAPLSSTVFHILLSLADRERHGYGIMQEVELMTQRQIRMGPGTLYGGHQAYACGTPDRRVG